MFKKRLLISAAVLLAPMTTTVAGDLATELRTCSELTDGGERLACFDAIAEPLADTTTDPEPAAEATAASEISAPTNERESAAGRGLDFGLPAPAVEEAQPDEITSRHVGEFRGWSGNTAFSLENGQVWRQVRTGRMHWVADSPMITIRRTAIGTYWLGVEGINAQVRVRRVE